MSTTAETVPTVRGEVVGSETPKRKGRQPKSDEDKRQGAEMALREAAADLRAAHEDVLSHFKKTIESAIEAGRAIEAARRAIKVLHSQGERRTALVQWCQSECGIGERSARDYVRVAKKAEAIRAALADGVEVRTVQAALKLLRGGNGADEGQEEGRQVSAGGRVRTLRFEPTRFDEIAKKYHVKRDRLMSLINELLADKHLAVGEVVEAEEGEADDDA